MNPRHLFFLIVLTGISLTASAQIKFFRFGVIGSEKPGVILSSGKRLDVSGFREDYMKHSLPRMVLPGWSNGLWPMHRSARKYRQE